MPAPRAYYNEIDEFAAAWLRQLIEEKAIAPGDVDTRSIAEVHGSDLRGYTQCHFFAGIGGWSLALRLAGWPDDRPVWTGSCPCQSFSAAGKQAGFADPRHLWPVWSALIRESRPPVVFGEQVEGAIGHGWLDLVSGDLEAEGYAVGAVVLGAHSVGAPHRRQRLWFVADRPRDGRREECADGRGIGAGDRTEGRPAGSESGGDVDCPVALANQQQQHGRGDSGRGWSESTNSGELGHHHHPGSQGRGCAELSARPDQRALGATGASGERVADAGVGTSERHPREVSSAEARQRGTDGSLDGDRAQRLADGGGSQPWSDLLWLPCRDGKARPTESIVQSLVAGLPEGLGYVRDARGQTFLSPLVSGTANRIGRLRGYGNSIVPAVAAEVIRAYLEAVSGA